jgi:hypothetical protein
MTKVVSMSALLVALTAVAQPASINQIRLILTKIEPVVVYITGVGPTDTVYVSTANDPRGQ